MKGGEEAKKTESFLDTPDSPSASAMVAMSPYQYLFKYIIIGDTGGFTNSVKVSKCRLL